MGHRPQRGANRTGVGGQELWAREEKHSGAVDVMDGVQFLLLLAAVVAVFIVVDLAMQVLWPKTKDQRDPWDEK